MNSNATGKNDDNMNLAGFVDKEQLNQYSNAHQSIGNSFSRNIQRDIPNRVLSAPIAPMGSTGMVASAYQHAQSNLDYRMNHPHLEGGYGRYSPAMAIPKAKSPMVQSSLRYSQETSGVDPNYLRSLQAYQQDSYQNNPRNRPIEEIESQSSSGEGNNDNQNANPQQVRVDAGNDERGFNGGYEYGNDQVDYKSSSHHTGPSENRRKQVEALNGRPVYGLPPTGHYNSASYRPPAMPPSHAMTGNPMYQPQPQNYPHYPPYQTSPQISNQRYMQYAVAYNQPSRGYPKPQMPAEDPNDYQDDEAQDYYQQEENAPANSKDLTNGQQYDDDYAENQAGSLKQNQQQHASKTNKPAKKKPAAPNSQQASHHRSGSDVKFTGSQQQYQQSYPNKKSSNTAAYGSSNHQGSKPKKGKAGGGAGNDSMWGELYGDGYGPENQGSYGGHFGSSKRNAHDYDSQNTKGLIDACKDWNKQQGSRHLQSLLNSGDSFTINTIIKELTPQLLEVSLNIFGNYVAQKMIEVGTFSLSSEQAEPRQHHERDRFAHEGLLLPRLRMPSRAQALRHHRDHRRLSHRILRRELRRKER